MPARNDLLKSRELIYTSLIPAKHGTQFGTPLRGVSALRQIDFLQKNKKTICKSLKTAKILRFKADFPLQGPVDES